MPSVWFNKKLNGQKLGRRVGTSGQTEELGEESRQSGKILPANLEQVGYAILRKGKGHVEEHRLRETD